MLITGLTEEQVWENLFNIKVENSSFDKEIQERQFIKIRLRLNVFHPDQSKLKNGSYAFGITYIQFTATGLTLKGDKGLK
jgi:hypothetical protein